MTLFTEKQLKQYAAYERVRKSGAFNMFDPRARAKTKLEKDDYIFVMENFAALQDAFVIQTAGE
jgi:hypothetical protein